MLKFLLPSSSVFDNPCSISNIRQTLLDLQGQADEKSIIGFLEESITYLCSDYQIEIANELLPAISSCFSLYPQYSLPLIDKFLKPSKWNEYLIVNAVSILFEIANAESQFDNSDFQKFIDSLFDEIFPQIQNFNNDRKLTIFGIKISPQFQNSLILNLLLLSKLTQKLFSDFFPFILISNIHSKSSKFELFLNRAKENGFIRIPQLTESISKDLTEILENQNFDSIEKMEKETLFFISQVIYYSKSRGEKQIDGMNEETIIPFIAITLNYHLENEAKFSPSIYVNDLLLKAVKSLNDSNCTPLFQRSIGIILSNFNDFLSNDSIVEMIVILNQKLINNELSVIDKTFLLSSLFNLLTQNIENLNDYLKKFIEKDTDQLLNFVFIHFSEIIEKVALSKLNLAVFNREQVIGFIEKNLSTEKSYQTVYFLENFCFNQPTINISDEVQENLLKIINEKFTDEKNIKDSLIIANFMKNNLNEKFNELSIDDKIKLLLSNEENLNLNDKMNIDEHLFFILNDSHKNIERSYQLFQSLIELLIKDKEMLHIYLSYYINHDSSISSFMYLSDFYEMYEKYEDEFINVTNEQYELEEDTRKLYQNYDFSFSSLKAPQLGISLIDKLFKLKPSYQLFLCLKNFASTFPILFKGEPQHIFDFVLPQLDYFYLIFEPNKNEKVIELVKTAYSALSFLFSTLKEPKILKKFLIWLFQNIIEFSNSQVLCFIILLHYLCDNIGVIDAVSLMAIKYNFLDTAKKLLQRKIQNKFFKDFYDEILCSLISQISSSLFETSLYNLNLDDFFDNCKHLPSIKIKKSIKNKKFSKEINVFIINTDYIRDFWIEYDYCRLKKYPNILQYLNFESKLNRRKSLSERKYLEYLRNRMNEENIDDNLSESIDYDIQEDAKFKFLNNFSSVFHSEMGFNERITSYKEGSSPKGKNLYENKTHMEFPYAIEQLKTYNEKEDGTNRKAIINTDFNGKKNSIDEYLIKKKDFPEKKVSTKKEINDEKKISNKINEENKVPKEIDEENEVPKEIDEENEVPKEIDEEKEIQEEINEENEVPKEINEENNFLKLYNRFYNINIDTENISKSEFDSLTIQLQIKEFIEILLMDSINDHCFSILLTTFEKAVEANSSRISDIDFVNSYFYQFEGQSVGSESRSSSKMMYHFLEILSIFIKFNQLSSIDSNKILNIILSPKWRYDSLLLMKTISIFRYFESLNLSFIHLVSFDIYNKKIVGERDLSIIQKIMNESENNKEKIYKYYQYYADKGNKEAISIYSILLTDTKYGNIDYEKAIPYIKKAIELNDPTAMYVFGKMLYEGKGVEKNIDESMKYISKSIELGSDFSINYYGTVFEKDTKKIVECYKKGIEEYNLLSLYNLSTMIFDNYQLSFFNKNEAIKNIKKAADQGILIAMHKYGDMLDFGEIPSNAKLSFEYFLKAAKKGYEPSIEKIVDIIYKNKNFLSDQENIEWLEKGEKMGIKKASIYLSLLKNVSKSNDLFDLASENDLDSASKYHQSVWEKNKFEGNTYECFAKEARKYKQILLDYKKDNTKVFIDPNFPPFKNWKRIDEIYPAPLFQKDLVHPSFVNQGSLGDCCAISALSRIANQHYLVPELFNYKLPNKILGVVENSINIKCGAVVIYFYAFGRRTPVLIDTLVPVDDKGKPFLSNLYDKSKSPWFCLVEKALIKLNGSFNATIGISFQIALSSFYFTYSKVIYNIKMGLKYKSINMTTLEKTKFNFDKLNEYYNKGYLIQTSIRNQESEIPLIKGLIAYHSYHVYNLCSYKNMNFVCLRNPWGHKEWKGKYSRNDKSIPSDIQKFLDYDNCPKGVFWMSEKDYFKIFNNFAILKHVHPDWNMKMFHIISSHLSVKNDSTYAVRITQKIQPGKKCRIHFLVEQRYPNTCDNKERYNLTIAHANGKKINLDKIQNKNHYTLFYGSSQIEDFTYDLYDINDILSVKIDSHSNDYTVNYYVTVICKYTFDLYDVVHPEKLLPEVNNPGIVFENTRFSNDKMSKKLKLKKFDSKIAFSLHSLSSKDYVDPNERDEQISKLFQYKKFNFKSSQVDTHLYSKVKDEPLGNGTNGTVFLVKKKSSGKLYAAKVLKKTADLQFLRELSILRSLKYPSIVHFIGFSATDFNDNNYPTIITEYIKGGSLYDLLEKVHKGTSSLSSTEKMIILIGIALGMDHLHNHAIIHRDLKFHNVLLNDDLTPKICDFGESKSFSNELDNGQCEIVGTPFFMAPEIINGNHYSYPVDVYSFGVISYFIYTDQFPDESHHIDLNKIDPKYKSFVTKLVDPNPSNRPTFEEIIKSYLNDEKGTWIEGADKNKIENYVRTLGLTLMPHNHEVNLDIFKSINEENNNYPEYARHPKSSFDSIINNNNNNEDISNLKKAYEYINDDKKERKNYDPSLIKSTLFNAGFMFFMGNSKSELIKEEDYFYAIKFLVAASLLKDRTSMYMLSQIYSNSSNLNDHKIAFKIASIAADLGSSEAERTLGFFYRSGKGVDQNFILSALYFKLSADKGNEEAMFEFANTLIANKLLIQNASSKNQFEEEKKMFNEQLRKAQKIVSEMEGKSYKIYKEFILTLDAIENINVAIQCAKMYYEMAADKGHLEANAALKRINCDDQDIPEYVQDLLISLSISVDD